MSGASPEVAAKLPNCVGFRVDTPFGAIGLVEELRRRQGRVVEVVVRAGKHGSRLLIFPASDVIEVIPADRRITLGAPFHLAASE